MVIGVTAQIGAQVAGTLGPMYNMLQYLVALCTICSDSAEITKVDRLTYLCITEVKSLKSLKHHLRTSDCSIKEACDAKKTIVGSEKHVGSDSANDLLDNEGDDEQSNMSAALLCFGSDLNKLTAALAAGGLISSGE